MNKKDMKSKESRDLREFVSEKLTKMNEQDKLPINVENADTNCNSVENSSTNYNSAENADMDYNSPRGRAKSSQER